MVGETHLSERASLRRLSEFISTKSKQETQATWTLGRLVCCPGRETTWPGAGLRPGSSDPEPLDVWPHLLCGLRHTARGRGLGLSAQSERREAACGWWSLNKQGLLRPSCPRPCLPTHAGPMILSQGSQPSLALIFWWSRANIVTSLSLGGPACKTAVVLLASKGAREGAGHLSLAGRASAGA